MAKRIYLDGNYLIKDDGINPLLDYDANDSVMSERGGSFFVKDSSNQVHLEIAFSDSETWFLRDGITAYTETTLRDFFRNNTGGERKQFVADETNIVATYLLNGTSEQQAVDGSITPVEFSYSPPAGFNFICSKIIFYMQGSTNFEANEFGNLTSLTNGWTMEINGVETISAKNNKDLGTFAPNMRGVEIYGKINRTLIGSLNFNDFADGADGITIRDGQSFKTIVKDDLSNLIDLETKIMGVLKPV